MLSYNLDIILGLNKKYLLINNVDKVTVQIGNRKRE